MKKTLLLIANGMPAAMDIGIGALIAAIAGLLGGVEVHIGHLIAGSLLALLPDLFIIVPVLRGASGRDINAQHTWLPHRPVLMLTLIPTIASGFLGWQWSATAFLCLLWHFLHDTPPIGEQKVLNWCWPLGTDPAPDDYHWNWLEQVWLQPTARSVVEIGVGGTALVTALIIADYLLLAALAGTGIAVGTAAIWLLWRTVLRQ